jgi:DNA polymerase-3 subunit gamma/tau
MSEYIVSARKYRPDSFESLIGQDNIARTLKNAILRGQLAHAYLFCGPRGVGKTSAARIFAKTINCAHPGPDMEPCGECESCRSFKEGRSYCIHELDAASNNGVEDIKALMEQVQVPPQVGKYSVFIIDEVHMLSTAAFNSFLKTLEEPPAHAIFILATTEKHKILPTILSRCQTYDFNRIGIPDIVKALRGIAAKEGVNVDDESLHVIAAKADGAMRDALTIFDQTVAFCGNDIHYDEVVRNLGELDYEYGFKLTDAFLAGDYATALLIFDEVLSKGISGSRFVSFLGEHFRNLLVSRTGGLESLLDFPASLRERFAAQAAKCSVKFLFDALSAVSQCESGFRTSTNQRLHVEYALLRLSFLTAAPAQESVAPKSAPAQKPEQPAPAPKAEPAPAQKPEQPAPKTEPAPAPKAEPAPAPAPKRSGSALSLSSLMEEPEADTKAASGPESDVLPSEEAVKASWPDLVKSMAAQPRLAMALGKAELKMRVEEGKRIVSFEVASEPQKKWIEERALRGLESTLVQLVGSSRLSLRVEVAPREEQKEVAYMPSDQAKVLMAENEEVKNLVIDLGLDIK